MDAQPTAMGLPPTSHFYILMDTHVHKITHV